MKRIFLDTSVLVSALVESHLSHERSFAFLSKAKDRKMVGGIAAHTLAELYSVLSVLPIKPPLTPEAVLQMLKENIFPFFEIVPLSVSDYKHVLSHAAELKRRGGSVYDALILQAAQKFKADQIITLNTKHFTGYGAEWDTKLSLP
jgi:predicted nucleic acid-binding protein